MTSLPFPANERAKQMTVPAPETPTQAPGQQIVSPGGEPFPETDSETESTTDSTIETQARLASLDIASRIPHSSVDSLLDSANKIFRYLSSGEITQK